MKRYLSVLFSVSLLIFVCYACTNSANENEPLAASATKENFGGFESQVKWGEHLVIVSGCHDCHTPKKMGPMGMVIDSSLMLSGHIAGSPDLDVNRKQMQDKGLVVTSDLTTWVGPWGVSYTANLTSDATGTGMWKEEQFILAIREGKAKGIAGNRGLLPPMPWDMYKHMTDDELKAIFAYLKTTKPIKNIVPQPLPPAS